MELQDFFKNALTQIIAGVAEAREVVKDHDAKVGSDFVHGNTSQFGMFRDGRGRTGTNVEFDILLTKSDTKDTKGGIGVFMGTVNLGSQGASHGETGNHSRIKFSVPIVLPGSGRDEEDKG